jgi:hypothetical protein
MNLYELAARVIEALEAECIFFMKLPLDCSGFYL